MIRPLTSLCLSCLVLTHGVFAQETADLIGLWGSEQLIGPSLRGELAIVSEDGSWRARIGSSETRVEREGSAVTCTFPQGQGSFHGQQHGDEISGHWVQPTGTMFSNEYATPLVLTKDGAGTWRGQVIPLDDRISIYVLIEREGEQLRAWMRNPERNLGARNRFERVVLDGQVVRLHDAAEAALSGTLSEDGARWTLEIPDRDVALEMTRRGRNEAEGFYPRRTTAEPYAYQSPETREDGWPIASPAEVGMQVEPLEALVESILATEYDGPSTPYVQAVLVARKGKLVLDESFYGYDSNSPHDTRSSAKSITSMLVGIALDRTTDFDVDTPILELIEHEARNVDELKHELTVEHLLSMQSGLACDDDDEDSPGEEGRMQEQTEEADWVRYTLDLPMIEEPGTRGVYCTGGINALGAAIDEVAAPLALFHEAYAGPLQFRRYHVNLAPNGAMYLGGGLHLMPRDHLKLGVLLADEGRWQGTQVVPADWIESASSAHATIHSEDDYGLGIWRTTLRSGGDEHEVVYASGNGGQLVIAIPELELVVEFAGGNYMDYRTWSRFLYDLVPQYVLAAIIE